MNLTEYTTLNVEMTKYSKVNNLFSLGRARIFYEGPNPNRTIFDAETSKNLISTIPGTPIVGRYNLTNEDFEGHGDGQIAYGFVPLEPNTLKVEVNEEAYGLPVKKVYYEVDVVIWEGRFPEAKKILEEEKSLSMELNPDTLDGEIEIYDDKHYLRVTNAEFFGITALGDAKTPCFKDAKFLQAYTNMLSAYEALGQKSNIGGTEMPETTETVVETEVNEFETTNTNEEASQEEVVTEEETTIESENAEQTPTEEGAEEGTEEVSETEEETTEAEEDTENAETSTEETNVEETNETPENEYEVNFEDMTHDQKYSLLSMALDSIDSCGYLRDFSDTEVFIQRWSGEIYRCGYTVENNEVTIDIENKTRVLSGGYVEYSEGESYNIGEKIEALESRIVSLSTIVDTYETAAKEELVIKFSSKINDSEFITDIKTKIADYTVEGLKSALGAKLAEQVLEEDGSEEVKGMIYSFNGTVSKNTTSQGWQDMVRASKESSNK